MNMMANYNSYKNFENFNKNKENTSIISLNEFRKIDFELKHTYLRALSDQIRFKQLYIILH